MARIELNNVSVNFPVYDAKARIFKNHFLRAATGGRVFTEKNQTASIRALNKISLSICHGDRVGLIGHNGSGKSTLLKLLATIYEPSDGFVSIQGNLSPMLDLMHGIETEFSGYENIMMRGIILGLSRKIIKKQMKEIAELTGLGDYLSMPVRTYSSGMMVRLAFAISTSVTPEILLIDEIFGAGDVSFMKKARNKMISLLKQSSIVVMASHSEELIREFCNKAIVLNQGEINYYGEMEKAMQIYNETKDIN